MSSRSKCVFGVALALVVVAGIRHLAPVRAGDADQLQAPGDSGAAEKAKWVMAALSDGSLEEAFDIMSRQSVMSQEQMAQMRRATNKARKPMAERIGRTTGTELVEIRKVSDHVTQVFFVELATVSPIYWRLVYYKQPAGKWVLTHAHWNLELSQVIQ